MKVCVCGRVYVSYVASGIPVILLTSGGLINLMSNDCKEFDWRSNVLIIFCMRNIPLYVCVLLLCTSK